MDNHWYCFIDGDTLIVFLLMRITVSSFTLLLLSTIHFSPLLVTHRTERVKSPGLDLEGRARKEPSMPRSFSSTSASRPETLGWNHLSWGEDGSVLGSSGALLPECYHTHSIWMTSIQESHMMDVTTSKPDYWIYRSPPLFMEWKQC